MATCVDLAKTEYPEKAGDVEIVPLQGVSLARAFNGKKLRRKTDLLGTRRKPSHA